MKRLQDPRWFLILMFLGIIASVPLAQVLKELRQGGEVLALEIFAQAPTSANLRSYEQSLEKANWLGRLTRPWLHFAQFRWLKDGAEKVVIGHSGWYFYKPGLNYMLARQEIQDRSNETNDPVAAIVHFRDQLAAHGIQLIVMPAPNKESIYPDRVTSRAESLRGIMAPGTKQLFARLREANVEVIDLFTVFGEVREQSASGSHNPLYLAQDTHWSPAGVALAAKSVARRLTELGWVQPGSVEYAERPAPVQRYGDLVRMMQAPQIERNFKPETVPTVQVIRCDTNQLYKDEAEAEILVLGDSFLRVYQHDEPNAAGFIAHLAKELKQPLMSLVNDGGGSTLVREELAARPVFLQNKKVVLWEFVERDIGLGLKGWRRTPLPPPPQQPVASAALPRANSKKIGNVLIEGNLITNCYAAGIMLFATDHYDLKRPDSYSDIRIINNKISDIYPHPDLREEHSMSREPG